MKHTKYDIPAFLVFVTIPIVLILTTIFIKHHLEKKLSSSNDYDIVTREVLIVDTIITMSPRYDKEYSKFLSVQKRLDSLSFYCINPINETTRKLCETTYAQDTLRLNYLRKSLDSLVSTRIEYNTVLIQDTIYSSVNR